MKRNNRTKKVKKKPFRAVEMKNKIQAELYKLTKDLTPDELIAFYREEAKAGPFKKAV